MEPSDFDLRWLEDVDPPVELPYSAAPEVNRSWREVLAAQTAGKDYGSVVAENSLFLTMTQELEPTAMGRAYLQAPFDPVRLALRLVLGRPHEEVHHRVQMMSPSMAYHATFGAFMSMPRVVLDLEPTQVVDVINASAEDRVLPPELVGTPGATTFTGTWLSVPHHMDDIVDYHDEVLQLRIDPVDIHDALETAAHRLAHVVAAVLALGHDPVTGRFDGMDWI